jgi:hypothetical protein
MLRQPNCATFKTNIKMTLAEYVLKISTHAESALRNFLHMQSMRYKIVGSYSDALKSHYFSKFF